MINVAAKEDQGWHNTSRTRFRPRDGEDVLRFQTYNSTWPFELKVRSWLPVVDEEGKIVGQVPANEANLRPLLGTDWLQDNPPGIDLLHRVFGFRQLTLMLENMQPDVETDLVELLQDPELVKAAAANPDAVKFARALDDGDVPLKSVREFVQDMEEDDKLGEYLANRRDQRKRVHENQNLGAIVENFVKENLEQAGFSVHRTGIGSDFEIAVEVGDLGELTVKSDQDTWLVEVKATRDQRVRMTSTQAREAVEEGDQFLLCVVPIEPGNNGVDIDDVRVNMRFVTGMGDRVSELCDDLGDFEERRTDITEETSSGVQLEITPGPARVRVFKPVWENDGFPLEELAERLISG